MSDFLKDMIERRIARIAKEFGALSPADRERLACCARPVRDVATALSERLEVAVIAEVKKASPSVGSIAPDCEASKQALHYQDGGAAVISVLTEPESFGGSFSDLSDVADAVDIPVLCKDFVVDPVQLFVARGHGADAVLLMVSVLGAQTAEYVALAETLGLTPLVEVIDSEELDIAVRAGARVVGINNRDLHTLDVDPARARSVVAAARNEGLVVVSASGVKERGDIEAAARAGADAVLIGETLMRSKYPEDLLELFTGVPTLCSSNGGGR
ncbi:MAG: indole-3-glycerol phosphate synthase TrpC [Actinomycetota bacterium]|jgi:indole-3-glycerol phosphate synthase|nr:indole-3-glycerol phosphate synthase TrpC [Actinomycetota bacterium]